MDPRLPHFLIGPNKDTLSDISVIRIMVHKLERMRISYITIKNMTIVVQAVTYAHNA